MSIKAKLLLVLGIVMAFLMLNIVQASYDALQQKARLKETEALVVLAEKLSLFIHETQKSVG